MKPDANRPSLSLDRLRRIVRRFAGRRILVVGDVMLDEFIWGRASRISPEAPVPVIDVSEENAFPGGAANVASNLRALGADVDLLGRIGHDAPGRRLTGLLRADGIHTRSLLVSPSVPTTVKTRVIARPQHVVRIDREQRVRLSDHELARARLRLRQALRRVHGVVVEDYGKGFLTQEFADDIARGCHEKGLTWTVDPNPGNALAWDAPTAIKPNRREAFAAAGITPGDSHDDVEKAGAILLERWKAKLLLITLGESGMALLQHGQPSYWSPTRAREVYDVSGAGDTAIAALTLALSVGATAIEAVEIANHAAGVVVGKLGTASVSTAELLASFSPTVCA